MIHIDNECHKNNCDDESAKTTVHLESDCRRERECKPKRHNECEFEFEEAFVRPAVVAVDNGTTIVQVKPYTTTVQLLNNPAPLKTYFIDVRPLGKHDKGNVVITSLGGIVLTSFSGTYGTTGVELNGIAAYLSLSWDGNAWVPAV
jgi:hypothetical protein